MKRLFTTWIFVFSYLSVVSAQLSIDSCRAKARANLVYAVKIAVNNDGLLKRGMYGEIRID